MRVNNLFLACVNQTYNMILILIRYLCASAHLFQLEIRGELLWKVKLRVFVYFKYRL